MKSARFVWAALGLCSSSGVLADAGFHGASFGLAAAAFVAVCAAMLEADSEGT